VKHTRRGMVGRMVHTSQLGFVVAIWDENRPSGHALQAPGRGEGEGEGGNAHKHAVSNTRHSPSTHLHPHNLQTRKHISSSAFATMLPEANPDEYTHTHTHTRAQTHTRTCPRAAVLPRRTSPCGGRGGTAATNVARATDSSAVGGRGSGHVAPVTVRTQVAEGHAAGAVPPGGACRAARRWGDGPRGTQETRCTVTAEGGTRHRAVLPSGTHVRRRGRGGGGRAARVPRTTGKAHSIVTTK
jgi:hypothetical protein